MPQSDIVGSLADAARTKFETWYRRTPVVGAYAPGRVEVLGNHTDYNEGFVLSAAIDFGTVFLAAPADSGTCRLVAGDLMEERSFPLIGPTPFQDHSWPNYLMGVAVGLLERGLLNTSFDALFFGNVPIGSGLSSSAALEMSAATALVALGPMRDRSTGTADPVELARIGQRSEHEFVGANTGLMDQITSLSGRENHLVRTDFRSLEIATEPFAEGYVLVTCDTQTRHSLGDSDYNERRSACEAATEWFAEHLDHRVTALRDVSTEEFEKHRSRLPPLVAKRAAHIVGENSRVTEGAAALEAGDVVRFGELMYQSHASSRYDFENSCDELDYLVDQSKTTGKVLGARLTGGGFGGSAVLLLKATDVEEVIATLLPRYRERFGTDFEPHTIHVSDGARLI